MTSSKSCRILLAPLDAGGSAVRSINNARGFELSLMVSDAITPRHSCRDTVFQSFKILSESTEYLFMAAMAAADSDASITGIEMTERKFSMSISSAGSKSWASTLPIAE